ncbi:MAG TPA: GNAT family N-acetyltransferase [Intrasporangium sp.]|uniref:GNAT family N-acetyltransferase n=1 Tax=Intrasporangium sp. TaxID=1925024 RepID=UPI002B464C46|nr:GNAT family N-acetyltransferase [Intrasporangium sp.]HKX66409.1 GNAT family N-acetyltransferase [Intrasporangium sp.]
MTGRDPHRPNAGTGAGDPSSRLTVGTRVVVRQRLVDTPEAGATDVIGRLAERTDDVLVIDTRRGLVAVPRRDVVAAKPVPPPATRPGPAHLRVSVDDLALVTAQGWVAVEQARRGSWLLRSAPGYTGRANSVLVVGDPGMPVDVAIDHCERWYAERDQTTMFQVNGPVGFTIADHPVAHVLLERGYTIGGGRLDWSRVLVMTGPLAGIASQGGSAPHVVADATLSEEWLSAYSEGRTPVPGVTEAVLTGSERQLFLSIREDTDGRIVAVARLTLHPGWAGVFGLWVHPDHRRQGLARRVMAAVATTARENRLPAVYLQVSEDNDRAIAFYEGLGFTVHHQYTYLVQPAA